MNSKKLGKSHRSAFTTEFLKAIVIELSSGHDSSAKTPLLCEFQRVVGSSLPGFPEVCVVLLFLFKYKED